MRLRGPKPLVGAAAAGRTADVASPPTRPARVAARRALAWALAAVVIAVAVAALQTDAGNRALDAIGVGGTADGYTAVELVRAPEATVDGGRLFVTLAVAIRDAEGESSDYRWRLITRNARVTDDAGGAVRLADGERRIVDVEAGIRCVAGAERAFVGVQVDPQPGRSVGAWIGCPGAPS